MHPAFVCANKNCVEKSCSKRHPKSCKFFKKDSCKFGSSCEFTHETNIKTSAQESFKDDTNDMLTHNDSYETLEERKDSPMEQSSFQNNSTNKNEISENRNVNKMDDPVQRDIVNLEEIVIGTIEKMKIQQKLVMEKYDNNDQENIINFLRKKDNFHLTNVPKQHTTKGLSKDM